MRIDTALATDDVPDHTEHAAGTPPAEPTAPVALAQDDAPPGEATVEVVMVDDRFDPDTLTVPIGTTVSWANQGADWHSIAAYDGSFESGKISPGESFSHRFDQPGTYQYICKHHGLHGMLGQIIVDAG